MRMADMWHPPESLVESSNVKQFMEKHAIEDYGTLISRSIENIEWFWVAAEKEMGVVLADIGGGTVNVIIVQAEVIGPKRSPMLQLEAAELMANKTTSRTEVVALAKPINEGATPAAVTFERGWRQLA